MLTSLPSVRDGAACSSPGTRASRRSSPWTTAKGRLQLLEWSRREEERRHRRHLCCSRSRTYRATTLVGSRRRLKGVPSNWALTRSGLIVTAPSSGDHAADLDPRRTESRTSAGPMEPARGRGHLRLISLSGRASDYPGRRAGHLTLRSSPATPLRKTRRSTPRRRVGFARPTGKSGAPGGGAPGGVRVQDIGDT